jgi:hypothetical protein
MYRPGHGVRVVMDDLTPQQQAEVDKLLLLAENAPPSSTSFTSKAVSPSAARKPHRTRCDPHDAQRRPCRLKKPRPCSRSQPPDLVP